MSEGFQLPWSKEAEVECIAAAFVDPASVDRVREIIEPEHFYHRSHAGLWEAVTACWREGAVDPVLVKQRLVDSGTWDELGGYQLLGAMLDQAGTTMHVERYARIVRDKARLRAIIAASQDTIAEALQQPEELDSFAATAEARLRSAAIDGSADTLEHARVGAWRAFERFAEPAEDENDPTLGVLTGYRQLDEWTDGLPRKLVICMGRPGMGKSTLALNLALRVARRGLGVFIWSGEMDREEVWGRLIAADSGVGFIPLTSRYALRGDDLRAASDSATRIGHMPIVLDCQTKLTADMIALRAARARRELGRLDLLIVDHFHLMRHPRAKGMRKDEAQEESSGVFRDLAKELRCVVLLCAQLNREAGKRPDKRPILEDLRECGALEQDVQIVLSPFRKYVYSRNIADKYEAEMLVLKNRNSAIGSFPLAFAPSTMVFRDAPP